MPHQRWTATEVAALYDLPFTDLVFRAHSVHRENFNPNEMQLSTLLSIKTGGCPENCAYCPQSAHYATGVKREKLMPTEDILTKAALAKSKGATRFCMGAAWRDLPKHEFKKITDIVSAVKALGLETCATLGMLDTEQAQQLQAAGLDYYNHNLDTSPDYYEKIISTRTYQERLDTLQNVRDAGMHVCCGGIIGMGETRKDRIEFLLQLNQLPTPPESIPLNRLIPIKGTPLEHTEPLDSFEFIRTVAVARIMMPTSMIRFSAGREGVSDEIQAWCFFAGCNSIFYGEKLLVADNADENEDINLLTKLGMSTQQYAAAT